MFDRDKTPNCDDISPATQHQELGDLNSHQQKVILLPVWTLRGQITKGTMTSDQHYK